MKRRRATKFRASHSPTSIAPSLVVGTLLALSGGDAWAKSTQPGPAKAQASKMQPEPGKVSLGAYELTAVPQNRSRSLPPLWIDRQRGFQRTQALLLPPVWFKTQDLQNKSQAQLLFPLAFWSSSPGHRAVHTPVASVVRGKRRRLTGVWPLLSFASQRGQDRDAALLAGLFWQRKRAKSQSSHWGLGPLFWSFQRGQTRSWWVPPLLSGISYGPTSHLQMLTPLLWHKATRPTKDQAFQHHMMAGPLFASWGPRAQGFSLFPLWLHHRSQPIDFTIAPLLLSGYRRKGDASTFISPLFVRHRAPGISRTGVAGLFWDVKDQDSRYTTLFPLFHRYQTPKRAGLWTPLGGSWHDGKTQRFLWGPVFGEQDSKSKTRGLFPVWAMHRSAHASVDLVAPLWLKVRSKQRDLDMITPLIWRTQTRGPKARRGLAVAPFYFRKREPGGFDLDVAPGFVWARDKRRRTHTLVVGPFYHRLSRKGLHTGIFPLTWWKDSVKTRRFVALPLVFHTEQKLKKAHTTVAFPLWFDRQRSVNVRTWLAFPFVLGREYPQNFLRVGIGAPGIIDTFSLRKNRRLTGWLPFFFRYQKCGFQVKDKEGCRFTAYGSFPLFYYGKTEDKRRVAHSALALYYFEKDGARRKFFTPLAGVDQEPQKRMTWYAGPLYRSVTNTKIRHGLVPFYMHGRDRLSDKQTTLVLPPLFIGQHREDRRWFEVGLLAWHFRSQHQVVTMVAPPIFGHQHTYAERKRSWLLPIYWDDHYMGKKSRTTAIFPLLWFRNRNPRGITRIQFPLWWDFERGQDRRTRLFLPPLWIDVQRSKDYRTRMIPGLWFHRDRKRKDTTVIGPGLAWWTLHEDPNPNDEIAADRDWRALFGLFGGGRKSGRPYFSLVGKPFWLAGAPAASEQKASKPAADPAAGVPVKEAPARSSRAR